MAQVLVEDTSLTAIGNALRGKLGETRTVEHKELIEYQDRFYTFYTKNAKQELNGGYINGTSPETKKSQTFSFPGASQIYLHYSGTGYGSGDLYYQLNDGKGISHYIPLNQNTSLASSPGIKELTINADSIIIKWNTAGSSSCYHFYMEIMAYNEDGTIYREPIYNTTYEEVRNEYKPAEMGPTITSSLEPVEELITVNITYTNSSSNTLDFSQYVKDYRNIRRIIFSGNSSSYVCLYDYQVDKENQKAGVENPHRIWTWYYSSGINSVYKNPTATSTDYYYFSDEEWNANGALHFYWSGASSTYTARYGKCVQLVYKKEN